MVVARCPSLRLLALSFLAVLSSCETNKVQSQAEEARAAQIAAEPRGSHWIGRRYVTEKTRFWGYLRRPGQPWEDSKLVVMNEAVIKVPDRFPEVGVPGGQAFGFDHNYQYKITGRYSGDTIYDPNSNAFLPEFVPTGFELLSSSPGWLFVPGESYDPKRLPSKMD